MDALILILPLSFLGYIAWWIFKLMDRAKHPEKYQWGTPEERAKQKELDEARKNNPNRGKGEIAEVIIQAIRHIKIF